MSFRRIMSVSWCIRSGKAPSSLLGETIKPACSFLSCWMLLAAEVYNGIKGVIQPARGYAITP